MMLHTDMITILQNRVSLLCRSRRRGRRHSVVDAGDDWTDIDDDVVRYVWIMLMPMA